MKAMRRGVSASSAPAAKAFVAGASDSRKGSERVVPNPLRKVRRGIVQFIFIRFAGLYIDVSGRAWLQGKVSSQLLLCFLYGDEVVLVDAGE
jgi:hypothetical protein